MYVSRAATRAAPAVFRAGVRTAARPSRQLPKHFPAIAILIPHRAVSTETSSNQNSNFPPPGFNAQQAKKPLPKDEQPKSQDKPNVATPKNEATAVPKHEAQDLRTLSELGTEKAEQAKQDLIAAKKEDEKNKLTLWEKVKKEVAHYRDGTKLLVTEVRISSKLALKMAAGYELTRREYRQVVIPQPAKWELR